MCNVMTKSVHIFFWVILSTLFLFNNVSKADVIYFKNGEELYGNIIVDNKEKMVVDVVIRNKLVGAKISVSKEEIKEIIKDGRYQHLVKNEILKEERALNKVQLRERSKANRNINKRILERVQREAEYIRKIESRRENKRRFEKELQHQKEMELLQGEVQKELIGEAVRSGINPNVYLINGN